MDDYDTLPMNPVDPDDQPQDETEEPGQKPPRSRLDRLKSAMDQAEKEARRWEEIEEMGVPLPSHDRSDEGVTQPILQEPPRTPGDTPPDQGTPPQGMPPVSREAPEQPKPAAVPGDQPPAAPRPPRPVPSFPHPTDPMPGAGTPPRGFDSSGRIVEPPVPDPLHDGDTPGVPPREEPLHRRYKPPEAPGDVRLDADGMPLPRRTAPRDPDATMPGRSVPRRPAPDEQDTVPHRPSRADDTQPGTYSRAGRVSPAGPPPVQAPPQRPGSRVTPPRQQQPQYPPPAPPAHRPTQAPPGATRPRKAARKKAAPKVTFGCIMRFVMLSMIAFLVLAVLGGTGAAIFYSQVTAPVFADIRTIDDLQARSLQFQTTRIRDREGNVLYQINDPNGGLRDTVTLNEVSPYIIVATVATEERDFFINPGFSVPAIIRAVIRNFQEGEVVSGASTITQQLTRALLLPEEERAERTYSRKIKEIFLAAELGRRFSKQEILELYLNQIYYGNLAYGIEAAAQTYFDKHASELTLAEASFLAGLPQAPAVWDPVNNPEGAAIRHQQVIDLMLEAGCLNTGSSGLQLPCTTPDVIAAAQPEIDAVRTQQYFTPNFQARYPHWVVYIQQILEADPAIGSAIYTSGFDVYTTLDPRLQDLAQQQVSQQVDALAGQNVTNGSAVVIDVKTGAILAMVGSRDFDNETIDGQVNIPLTLQQPGSSIKPFTYIAAFRQGWTPATVIWDVPIRYEIPGFGIYEPVNYDGRYHGPVSVRSALANSYNVPAVLTLDYVGVPALLQVLNDVGITTLGDPSNPNNFGLSLTLGAGDVKLLEWTNAFATIANGGVYRPPYAIERIELNGQVLPGYPYQVPAGRQAIDPDHAFLMASILSDGEARIPAFGANSVLTTPYPAGAKTGTTNDFRDNWTMGFTSQIAVGVWVGNTDNSPMINVSGVTGAGPIWRAIMDGAVQWYPPQEFNRPPTVFLQTICPDDGTAPITGFCEQHVQPRTEWFSVQQQPPPPEQGLYRSARVDAFTGLIANQYCDDYVEDRFYLALPNPSRTIDAAAAARDWLLGTELGRAWAEQRGIPPEQLAERLQGIPTGECTPDTPRPIVVITSPAPGSEQSGVIPIIGSANAPNFSHYIIEFGISADPQGWGTAQGRTSIPIDNNIMGQLDLNPLPDGPTTLRLLVFDTAGHVAETRVVFNVVKPTPTPTPTGAPTETPGVATETPEAPTPSPTVEPTAAATATP